MSATPASASHRVTRLLHAWRLGDEAAIGELTPLVHAELRRMARQYVRRERRDISLPATGLVNECYVRLVDARNVDWQNRAHFLALASRIMRHILVDVARARHYGKRGGGIEHIAVHEQLKAPEPGRDLVALDDALRALAVVDERKARVVELRFFGGLSNDETAAALDISTKTVIRDWQFAKVWLFRELTSGHAGVPGVAPA